MQVGHVGKTQTYTVSKQESEVNAQNNVKNSQVINQQDVNNNTNIDQYIKEHPGYIPTISEDAIKRAIEDANKKLVGVNTEVQFSIHEKTNQIVVKVVNSQTKETIREIPSEKILDMVANMCEIAGLLVDKKR